MKKQIIYAIMALTVIVIITVQINLNVYKLGKKSYISLSNIEALAQDESKSNFATVTCTVIETWDEGAKRMVRSITILCEGNGSKSCEC